jgi:uncharacterized membrane protein
MLLVAGWFFLRRDRQVLAGAAIGVATSLKLFPGLLLIYFLLRHRRAFWSGVATILLVNVLTAAVFGPQSYLDYLHTARFVTGNWGTNRDNWSLLAALHHCADILGIPALSSRAAFLLASAVLVLALALLTLALSRSSPSTDLSYAAFVVAMIWLSPTCWSHYFVILLLPLFLLAQQARSAGAGATLAVLMLFLIFAVPHSYHRVLLPYLEPSVGTRPGMLLLLLPSLALLGMLVWLAYGAWQSSAPCASPSAAAHPDSSATLPAFGSGSASFASVSRG